MNVRVNISMSYCRFRSDDAENQYFTGTVDLEDWNEDREDDICFEGIGTLEGCIIPRYVRDEWVDVPLNADEWGDIQELVSVIWDYDEDNVKEELCETFGDILCLTTIEINEEFRGQNIGLHVVSLTLDMVSRGCGIVVLKATSESLRKYWSRLGFQIVPGTTDFMSFDLCRKRPDWELNNPAERVLPEDFQDVLCADSMSK